MEPTSVEAALERVVRARRASRRLGVRYDVARWGWSPVVDALVVSSGVAFFVGLVGIGVGGDFGVIMMLVVIVYGVIGGWMGWFFWDEEGEEADRVGVRRGKFERSLAEVGRLRGELVEAVRRRDDGRVQLRRCEGTEAETAKGTTHPK